jgi:hypothetical protein
MEEWTRRVGYIVAGLTVAAVILGIVFFVTQSISESDERQDQLELACIESGGTWTTLGGSRVDKACYQIGVVEGADR